LGDEGILVLDTGLFCTIGETVWQAISPKGFCGSSVGRFMGVAVPTALGVAISNSGSRIVCAAGDGGIRPYLPEIRLAVEKQLPIAFILMADGQFGSVAASGRFTGVSERTFRISGRSWWRSVEAMGCPALPVADLSGLDALFVQWLGGGGPIFMELQFDPEKYLRMTDRLR
jgi:acetolactate synthase-1/2/3 large subunit